MYPTISTLVVSEIYTGICRCAEDGSVEALFKTINRENLGTCEPVDGEEWRPIIVDGEKVFLLDNNIKDVIYILSPGESTTLVHKPVFFIDENGYLCSCVCFIDHRLKEIRKVEELLLLKGGTPIKVVIESKCPS